MVFPEQKITPPGVGIQVPGYRTGVNTPPRRSNQTPEGPGHPMPLLSSQFKYAGPYKQRIKTWLPHTTPNLDNNYQGAEHNYAGEQPWRAGIRQRIKVPIHQIVPGNVYPDTYIDEAHIQGGVKTIGLVDITGNTGYPKQIQQVQGVRPTYNAGRINPPAGYSIPGPRPVKTVGYGEQPWQPGIRQHMTVPITQIVPTGVYPDTYAMQPNPIMYKKMSYQDSASVFLLGGIIGFALGAILFTNTGRNIAKAAGQRTAQYIGPKA